MLRYFSLLRITYNNHPEITQEPYWNQPEIKINIEFTKVPENLGDSPDYSK